MKVFRRFFRGPDHDVRGKPRLQRGRHFSGGIEEVVRKLMTCEGVDAGIGRPRTSRGPVLRSGSRSRFRPSSWTVRWLG